MHVVGESIRKLIERWLDLKVPARVRAMQDVVSALSPDRGDELRALASDLDSLAQQVRSGAPYDREQRAALAELSQLEVACVEGPNPTGAGTTFGRIAPEAIQLVVRTSFARFRRCYEAGLQKNPNLEGRVRTKFIISESGSVELVADGGSELPDPDVVQCVVGEFGTLRFGPARRGKVTVVYPIRFNPHP